MSLPDCAVVTWAIFSGNFFSDCSDPCIRNQNCYKSRTVSIFSLWAIFSECFWLITWWWGCFWFVQRVLNNFLRDKVLGYWFWLHYSVLLIKIIVIDNYKYSAPPCSVLLLYLHCHELLHEHSVLQVQPLWISARLHIVAQGVDVHALQLQHGQLYCRPLVLQLLDIVLQPLLVLFGEVCIAAAGCGAGRAVMEAENLMLSWCFNFWFFNQKCILS